VAAPKPAIVVSSHVGHDRERGCFAGDVVASLFQRLGAVGIVTDSGFRDLEGIRRRAPGFQIFSPGCVASHGNVAVLEVGTCIEVGGTSVATGDLLHGDANGIVNVPLAAADRVASESAMILEREENLIQRIRDRDTSLDELKLLLGIHPHDRG
jgi:regulator of RNase E activity RraA